MTTDQRFLLTNIGDLITLQPIADQNKLTSITSDDLGRHRQGWLAIEDGKIAASGVGQPSMSYRGWPSHEIGSRFVMPGLVDCHTHPVFGGNRSNEFARRLDGETYQSIAAAGGGIKYTVRQTRAASREFLRKSVEERFANFLSHGVTTLEAKSGYGLTVKDELRLLHCINEAAEKTPQTVRTTCLALHALMPEYDSVESFVELMTNELLPEVAASGLAQYVDAFVENGYFSVTQTEPYIEKAHSLGLGIRVHADEFADAGASAAAARWRAASADHAEFASSDAITAMAEQKVVAVILPGTSLYAKIPFANAARFTSRNCPVALATDYNPGSCQIDNINFIATLGALYGGLSSAETAASVTYVPAFSLGLADRKGALAPGYDADLVVFPYECFEDWLADIGRNKPEQVWISGTRLV